jgi:hypothetical protein
MNSFI